MHIQLTISDRARVVTEFRKYDPDLDNIISILREVMEKLEGQCDLIVSGFGEERWNTWPCLDAEIVLEQLPDILSAIADGRDFNLDFYEQHLQRFIAFQAAGDVYIGKMRSLREAQTFPLERLKRYDLITMLHNIRDVFVQFCQKRQLSIVSHPWFHQWLRDTGIQTTAA